MIIEENVFMLSPILKKVICGKINKGESLSQIELFLTNIALKKIHKKGVFNDVYKK